MEILVLAFAMYTTCGGIKPVDVTATFLSFAKSTKPNTIKYSPPIRAVTALNSIALSKSAR